MTTIPYLPGKQCGLPGEAFQSVVRPKNLLDLRLALTHRAPVFIDRWQVLEEVKEGAWATVFKACGPRGETVAIKIAEKSPSKTRALQALDAEMVILENLSSPPSPNIVLYVTKGVLGPDTHYLVMEYIDGINLMDALVTEIVTLPWALEITRQTSLALQHARIKGHHHKDVKPDNIRLRSASGQAVLFDFGLAGLTGAPGHLIGTPYYQSPQQMRGEPFDQQDDIYALGVTLLEMVAGLSFFGKAVKLAKYFPATVPVADLEICHPLSGYCSNPGFIPFLRKWKTENCFPNIPHAPTAVNTLIQRMTAPDKSDRPASPLEVADTIRSIQRELWRHIRNTARIEIRTTSTHPRLRTRIP